MSKFVNSREATTSNLLLWSEKPTQVSIQETYDIKVWPATHIFNDGPINLTIPPQANGMLYSVDVVTKFKIATGKDKGAIDYNLSVVNNIANAIWETVEVSVDDRLDLMQSMRNAYAYQTYFNTCLNGDSSHQDYLFATQLFHMDNGADKSESEETEFLKEADSTYTADQLTKDKAELAKRGYVPTGIRLAALTHLVTPSWSPGWTEIDKDSVKTRVDHVAKNKGALARASRVNKGQSVTVTAPLQCPLLTTGKCLPTNMKIRVTLNKNSDKFLLLTPTDSSATLEIEDVHLNVVYYRPRDGVLKAIEEQLVKEPAPYFLPKPEIIIKPITGGNRVIRVTNVFNNKLPSYAFFCLQQSSHFEGARNGNPFAFIPFGKFQIFVNGTPHFVDPLEVEYELEGEKKIYRENYQYLVQLYKTIGKDLTGHCLINSENFQLNFLAGVSFTADRSTTKDGYLNLQNTANTYLEIDMDYDTSIPNDMVMVIYAIFDRQIQIDSNRSIKIIE